MKIKQLITYLLLLVFLPAFAQQKKAQTPQNKPFTVVIDAGHGGHDPGAVGRLIQEKKLNLDVSLLLGQMIEKQYPDVKVHYTRKTDVYLTLQERANIVNKKNADLFICVHTNASESREAKGAETFVLGIDKMQSNLSVAMRENSVMLLEENYETNYQGFDPSSIDSYIMFELMQDQYIDQSLQYATLVQQQFCGTLHRADRGVRQAGFWVLHKSACPSVLVEMGFISNNEEEKYLASDKGKNEIAQAMFDAFVSYKTAYDKKMGKPVQQMVTPTQQTAKPVQQAAQPAQQPAETSETQQDSVAQVITETPAPKPEVEKPVYRVQIFSTTRALPKNDPTFKGLKNCRYTVDGKFYKYTYGNETDYQKILQIQRELKSKFPDCFIVAFLGKKQITVKQARAM